MSHLTTHMPFKCIKVSLKTKHGTPTVYSAAYGVEEKVRDVTEGIRRRFGIDPGKVVRLCKANGHALDPELPVGHISVYQEIELELKVSG